MAVKKKKKIKPIGKLKKEAAELLQRLVRLKAGDDNGYCSCVCCGIKKHYREMDGGHFVPRGTSETNHIEAEITKDRNMKEEWRIIKEYPKYKVSNRGNVKGAQGFNLSMCQGDVGYHVINMRKNGKQIQHRIHRLVAEAFIANPNNYPQVNHIDGDKTNNLPSNLEWVTSQQNITHAVKIGLVKAGIDNENTIPVQAEPVNAGIGYVFFGSRQLREFGFNQGNVSNTCNGRQKTHYGYKWTYISAC